MGKLITHCCLLVQLYHVIEVVVDDIIDVEHYADASTVSANIYTMSQLPTVRQVVVYCKQMCLTCQYEGGTASVMS